MTYLRTLHRLRIEYRFYILLYFIILLLYLYVIFFIAYLIISKYQYISKDLFYITYAMYSDPWNANKIEVEIEITNELYLTKLLSVMPMPMIHDLPGFH